MKRGALVASLYTLIAALASGLNILTQILSNYLYEGPYAIEFSVLLGTVSAAVFRYALVKRHIFRFEATSVSHDSRLFVLYSSLGLLTTGIFWATEFAFYRLFLTDTMRYMGAAIGLTISYVIKYQLDKHFVFVNRVVCPVKVA